MGFSLSVNTNPLVNRFAEPEDLIGTLAEEVGIGHIQLVHEFINPSWPAATVKRLTDRLARACAAQAREDHLDHDRALWPAQSLRPSRSPRCAPTMLRWFKGMADIAGDLGAPAIGTQFGIFTFRDYDDAHRRADADADRSRLLARALPRMRRPGACPTCSGNPCRWDANWAIR